MHRDGISALKHVERRYVILVLVGYVYRIDKLRELAYLAQRTAERAAVQPRIKEQTRISRADIYAVPARTGVPAAS